MSAAPKDPWLIHFFQRHVDDAADRAVPSIDFLDGLSIKVAAEIHAVLDAVAKAPPPSFSGGGKWEAMHGDMAGFFEVRVQGGGKNHRLFCLLERDADDLGGSSIVCLGGLSKPLRTAASPATTEQSGGTVPSSRSGGPYSASGLPPGFRLRQQLEVESTGKCHERAECRVRALG